ncbi:MAG TPA: lysophospholipid acyltransferase family protein [Methylophilaceae bacterium]|jgi:KDO2-lipid IV(A) lauroyltransferase|nr:lysophospholipid acyltransferase family protein [Methylophilaceae bacterium]HCB67727.1 lysophospholipid acyltransferase family protein [Methylophilaceae bacterium]HCC72800.1 lysophospholipid acyltransferase family protein [Methylophilaceae bacterium]
MLSRPLLFFIVIFFKLPLFILHLLGGFLGRMTYQFDRRFKERIDINLKRAFPLSDANDLKKLTSLAIREIGKCLMEAPAIWFNSPQKNFRWVRQCYGWEHVEAALKNKKGIIFLTPHLGCFEITAQYYAHFHPITVLFKRPKQKWLADIVLSGRRHSNIHLAEANIQGVKQLMQALKKGEAIGILPDQVPHEGQGEWTQFFNTPAYTMTLVSKLAESSKATVLIGFGHRLLKGGGYEVFIEPLGSDHSPQGINDQLELLIRKYPTQYLWNYQRFKKPNK